MTAVFEKAAFVVADLCEYWQNPACNQGESIAIARVERLPVSRLRVLNASVKGAKLGEKRKR